MGHKYSTLTITGSFDIIRYYLLADSMNNLLDKIYKSDLPDDMPFAQVFLTPVESDGPNNEEENDRLLNETANKLPEKDLFTILSGMMGIQFVNLFPPQMELQAKLSFALQFTLIGFEAGTKRINELNLTERIIQAMLQKGFVNNNSEETRNFVDECLNFGASFFE
jgi:hypothetical protein